MEFFRSNNMISMYTKQEIIIRCYRQGQSQRQIAKELHVSRRTVKKYIEAYEQVIGGSNNKETAHATYLSHTPSYTSGSRPKVKLTALIQEAIDGFLEQNRLKLQQGLRKQLLKKRDIFEALQKQGFDIGYTTVCNYIRNKGKGQAPKEAFIRQVFQPGSVCEFDWGEIKLTLSGRLTRLQLSVFTSAYGNYRYAFIYNRQNTLSFMESHVRFFEKVGGVHAEMVYDNMRVAVAKFIGPHEKEPTRALLQLRGHYQFQHRFCNAYRGNEKGHVERSVEYVRRKAFALRDHFTDIKDAQKHLCATLNRLNDQKQTGSGQTANEMLLKEKAHLLQLPAAPLICSEQVQLRVDKYATISYGTNRYSVPDHLVGEFVEVNILSDQLSIYHQNKHVATHKRCYLKHEFVIEIEHYLATFKKKPGALPGSLALASNIYLKTLYIEHFSGEPRAFIDLLSYCRKQRISEEKLDESMRRLLDVQYGHLTVEKLRALLGNQTDAHPINADDSICVKAKQQLLDITKLLN
jgi:transposase